MILKMNQARRCLHDEKFCKLGDVNSVFQKLLMPFTFEAPTLNAEYQPIYLNDHTTH